MPPIVRLLLNRLWTSVLVLFGVSILIFCIARVIPGDPARIALGPNASDEQIHQLRETLRLNEPLPVQYVAFLGDLTEGDLGLSLYTNRPVTQDIAQFLPATLELITLAAFLMVVIGLPLGGHRRPLSRPMGGPFGAGPGHAGRLCSRLRLGHRVHAGLRLFRPDIPDRRAHQRRVRHPHAHRVSDHRRPVVWQCHRRRRCLAPPVPAGTGARHVRDRANRAPDPREHGGDLPPPLCGDG